SMDPSQLKKIKSLLGEALNSSDYSNIPDLQTGQAIVTMGGRERYQVKMKPSERQLEIFAGGQ
ncbi:hypothetical protein QP290_26400, partial [Escherichia coli]|nr:hypothetical protein [Escherichia coli]